MPQVHVLFWFDVEDCTVTHSDDAAKRLALILERHGVRGTFKVVGQKARMLEQRIRYDVIDALERHDIGFHSNWHGLRPQIAEYLGPLDWEEGVAELVTVRIPNRLRGIRADGHRWRARPEVLATSATKAMRAFVHRSRIGNNSGERPPVPSAGRPENLLHCRPHSAIIIRLNWEIRNDLNKKGLPLPSCIVDHDERRLRY